MKWRGKPIKKMKPQQRKQRLNGEDRLEENLLKMLLTLDKQDGKLKLIK